MVQDKKLLIGSLVAAAVYFALPQASQAVTFTEIGEAGQTLATAQSTGTNATTALTAINGTIAGTNGLDADLYRITITSTSTFSAIASSSAGIDTSLFLFNALGVPVYANDDQSNTSFQAGLPAGSSLLTTLSPGTYFLGVSLSGNEAVNLNSQQLFTVDQPTTAVRGIASGLNPTTLATFSGATFFAEGGAYSIALIGANTAVPEPATTAMLVLGGAAASFLGRRRLRRQQAA